MNAPQQTHAGRDVSHRSCTLHSCTSSLALTQRNFLLPVSSFSALHRPFLASDTCWATAESRPCSPIYIKLGGKHFRCLGLKCNYEAGSPHCGPWLLWWRATMWINLGCWLMPRFLSHCRVCWSQYIKGLLETGFRKSEQHKNKKYVRFFFTVMRTLTTGCLGALTHGQLLRTTCPSQAINLGALSKLTIIWPSNE